MRLRGLRKGALLVTASSLLIALVTLVGLFAFIYHNADGGRAWDTPMERVSAALTWDGTAYTFTGEGLLKADRWGMLLDQEGRVVWSFRKPEEIPEQYTLTDVAAFTRWYLNGYPVQSGVREDGLLVVGSPKGSVWKHDVAMNTNTLRQAPVWVLVCFLLALGSVLGLAWLAVRRWFRQEQRVRDAARSD